MTFYLGIDFGTSGARAIAITADQDIHAEVRVGFSSDSVSGNRLTDQWRHALLHLLNQLPAQIRNELGAIAINGTSSTVLLCDENGSPITDPILYNDDRGKSVLGILGAIAPPQHPVMSATSSLAKYLWWTCQRAIVERDRRSSQSTSNILYFLHQADWLAFLLHGKLGISDYHNSLKLGYDVGNLCYPDWMQKVPDEFQLPQVMAPGTPIGELQQDTARQLQISADCQVCAGTTDSIAAFLASGAHVPGEAVTSLGSTLVLKLLSTNRVDDAHYGIYSHRLGDLWLVGGASNTGGAVLSQFFESQELQSLSERIDPNRESPLDYYPLTEPGERFPISDPQFAPRLEPRPEQPVDFLHGLLEGIARIEALGYRRLQELGAPPLSRVYTAGGGAQNPTWTSIRARQLGVELAQPIHREAAYGSALLALRKQII
ncbi:MAG: FGGY-family carbohydrate kinase [Elainellaceae cyanobacterium]